MTPDFWGLFATQVPFLVLDFSSTIVLNGAMHCIAMVQKLSAMTSAVILCGIGLLFVIASNLCHEMLPQCSKNLILWLLRRTTDWLTLMW